MTGSSGLPIPPLKDRIDQKIEEAEFFLAHINRLENVNTSTPNDDEKHIRFYASALLNAIRSPLQYMVKQIGSDSTKRTWYDTAINTRLVLGFLADERNTNIHTMQTTPIAHHVKTFDVGATSTQHQEWPNYAGTDKTLAGIAQDGINKVREIEQEGFTLGHLS